MVAVGVFVIGVLMLRWAGMQWGIFRGDAGADGGEPIKSNVALKTLSRLWREETVRTIKMEELAQLWKKGEEAEEEPDPEFRQEAAKAFYQEHIKGQKIFQGHAGKVVMELLFMLDREGDCPSVVPMDVTQDPEAVLGRKEKSTYDIFAHFTLLEHSIHVAEEARRIYGDGPDLAEAFIAALGHDQGKLPRHRDSLYAIGDHPMLSTAVLEALPAFKALPNREEIQTAIRTHHGQGKIKDEDTFAKLFYEADKAARLREIGEFAAKKGEEAAQQTRQPTPEPVKDAGRAAPDNPVEQKEPPAPAPEVPDHFKRFLKEEDKKPPVVLPPEVAVAKASAALEGMEQSRETQKGKSPREEIQKAEVSWFRSDIFLAKIKPIINKVGPFGGKWKAISMRDGYVYVQTGYLWDVARELGMAMDDALIRLGEGDQKVRQEILLGVVSKLRDEGFIAAGLIKEGYIGGKFTLKVKTPQGQKDFGYYLTPFMAEAFASTVSELEKGKEGNAKNVTEVVPDYQR